MEVPRSSSRDGRRLRTSATGGAHRSPGTARLRREPGGHHHIEVVRSPGEAALSRLVGDLSTGSATFATKWARHDVRFHRSAHKQLRTTVVGEIELTGDALELPGQGLTVIVYTAEAGSPARQQLDFSASWAPGPETVALGGRSSTTRGWLGT
ncbi:MAG: hypothetical protein M0Z87_03435 [Actinomycetota bacterium]|nr:hypothetical protein [Actinomycetota bacterium]